MEEEVECNRRCFYFQSNIIIMISKTSVIVGQDKDHPSSARKVVENLLILLFEWKQ